MHDCKRTRYIAAFCGLIITGAALMVISVCTGSIKIPFSDIAASVMGKEIENSRILWDIRMPRMLAAAILGGALALSGYLLQIFFHNPIAGPFVLGISSGSKMVVALVMVFLMGNMIKVNSAMLIMAAFAGAVISMGLVLLIARRAASMSMLVVSGVMIGYICNAVTDIIVTFASDSEIVNLHNWSKGSFSGITWSNVCLMAAVVAVTAAAAFFLAKPLNAYQLGEIYALNMGVNIKKLRIFIVIISSILSACIVAFAGPVSFVGIAVPHIIKNIMKTSDTVVLIPACFIGGGVFCMFCDLLARTMCAPTEMAISTVTAVFGAPVVLWVMLYRKKEGRA